MSETQNDLKLVVDGVLDKFLHGALSMQVSNKLVPMLSGIDWNSSRAWVCVQNACADVMGQATADHLSETGVIGKIAASIIDWGRNGQTEHGLDLGHVEQPDGADGRSKLTRSPNGQVPPNLTPLYPEEVAQLVQLGRRGTLKWGDILDLRVCSNLCNWGLAVENRDSYSITGAGLDWLRCADLTGCIGVDQSAAQSGWADSLDERAKARDGGQQPLFDTEQDAIGESAPQVAQPESAAGVPIDLDAIQQLFAGILPNGAQITIVDGIEMQPPIGPFGDMSFERRLDCGIKTIAAFDNACGGAKLKKILIALDALATPANDLGLSKIGVPADRDLPLRYIQPTQEPSGLFRHRAVDSGERAFIATKYNGFLRGPVDRSGHDDGITGDYAVCYVATKKVVGELEYQTAERVAKALCEERGVPFWSSGGEIRNINACPFFIDYTESRWTVFEITEYMCAAVTDSSWVASTICNALNSEVATIKV